MREWLICNFAIPSHRISVFYDRPHRVLWNASEASMDQKDPAPKALSLVSLPERHRLLLEYSLTADIFGNVDHNNVEKSLQTIVEAGSVYSILDPIVNASTSTGRCFIIISSTSWTPDENFDILLEAMLIVDKSLRSVNANRSSADPVRVLVVVTGKGPLKKHYEERFQQLETENDVEDNSGAQSLRFVRFRTLWLAMEDYPLMIGLADIGICLHTSTSGLDLPMKVSLN
jgi:beta-1,4-mannosyltransferase